LNILLVEDSPADARFTREALEASGLTTRLAVVHDGAEAMRYLSRQGEYVGARRPDIVLLDLDLPAKDGREVLREMKSDPELRIIPVVMFTTSTREEDITDLYRLHANCYITKPVDFDQFVEVVQAIEHFWSSVAALPTA
jgi:two-component system, chemotaxis family, response regulator Rcp1